MNGSANRFARQIRHAKSGSVPEGSYLSRPTPTRPITSQTIDGMDNGTTYYIGLCCSAHDPAIAVMNSKGVLLFAEATERYLQYKRALNVTPDVYPYISFVLAGYTSSDARIVLAKNWSRGHFRNVRIAELLLGIFKPFLAIFPFLRMVLDRYTFMLRLQHHAFAFAGENLTKEWRDKDNQSNNFILKYKRSWLDCRVSDANVDRKRSSLRVRHFDHHRTHAAAAAYASPSNAAVVAVIDGYGENSSTAFYHFVGDESEVIRGIGKSKNSLGFYYSYLCAACGFNPDLGDEWKVMGLAPYGKEIPELYKKLSALIPVELGRFPRPNALFDKTLFDKLNKSGEYAKEDIAFTGQKVFEDKIIAALNHLTRFSDCKNLVLVGGCALNSSANGKILERTPYEALYVYHAPGDDGTAVGAAVLAYLQEHPAGAMERDSLRTPYTGAEIGESDLARVLSNCPHVYDLGERKYDITARLLCEGAIIGWVQGRAEFGPRALGNRSILADPRNDNIKEFINRTIKFREAFRPFAPSILEGYGADIFEGYGGSHHMDKTLRVRQEYRSKIPGVTHVDGTGRVHSVSAQSNLSYFRLLSAFHAITSVPVLLNTSFNLAGKPIIHDVHDAIATLYSSGLTGVVIGDYLISKAPMNFAND